jgi:hypothetical protein
MFLYLYCFYYFPTNKLLALQFAYVSLIIYIQFYSLLILINY